MLNLKKWGWCWVSSRSGWLLELLTELKIAIILPTGQWYAPSAVINDAWYCMVLHGIAWFCMVLHGFGMDLAWIWQGFGMDLAWIEQGFGMDLAWIWHGFGMDLEWIWAMGYLGSGFS